MTDTVTIKLTRGKVTIIDAADYALVSDYKWHAAYDGHNWYAQSQTRFVNKKRRTLSMHRVILGLEVESRLHVDHKDRDGLNNRRSNLRIATPSQNRANARPVPNKTGYIGVHFGGGAWRAKIRHMKRGGSFGRFETPELAARAYDKKAKELFGEFAQLNFPETENYR